MYIPEKLHFLCKHSLTCQMFTLKPFTENLESFAVFLHIRKASEWNITLLYSGSPAWSTVQHRRWTCIHLLWSALKNMELSWESPSKARCYPKVWFYGNCWGFDFSGKWAQSMHGDVNITGIRFALKQPSFCLSVPNNGVEVQVKVLV